MSHSTRGETEELERLASQLTLSETGSYHFNGSNIVVLIQQLDSKILEIVTALDAYIVG